MKYLNLFSAAAYLASTLGIDVHRLLREHSDQLEELQKIGAPLRVTQTRIVKEVKEHPSISANEKVIASFLLPSNLAVQAKKTSKIYPHFYVFENLLRYVILSILEKKYGKN